MRFNGLVSCGLMLLATGWTPAAASSDYFEARTWTVTNRNLISGNNLALMQPGNDTRVNLMLLLQDDRRKVATSGPGHVFFNWGELSASLYPEQGNSDSTGFYDHSRCQTNETGRDAFVQVVRSVQRLPEAERGLLISVRQAVAPDCEVRTAGSEEIVRLAAIQTPLGQEFAVYLRSALSFYNGDFEAATRGFSSLVGAKNDWLKETSLYMIARSELNRSQAQAFDEYGYFAGPQAVGEGAIRNAERGFNLYLKIYPDGSYQQSAKGLLRRVYWLAGDTDKLSNEYAQVLDQPGMTGARLPALIQEVDDKLLSILALDSSTSDPELLAMVALYRMRKPYDPYEDEEAKPAISRSEIEAMQGRLASRPGLLEYLLAAQAFYVADDPKTVLQLIPDEARQSRYTYLDFSRQVLRGAALEAVGDHNARGFWRQLVNGADRLYQRGVVELALAMNLERGDAVADVFAANSAVETPVLREILLQYAAGPPLLRKQAKDAGVDKRERDLALYVLLYRQLTHGAYAGFLGDLNLVPANAKLDGPFYNSSTENDYGYEEEPDSIPLGLFTKFDQTNEYGCPVLKQTVQMLASNPKSDRGQLCLADYLRLAGFDRYWLDERPDAGRLGGSKSPFLTPEFSRLEAYKTIIANRNAKAENRAYALYRAVWCYGPAGINSCGGVEVEEPQRAAWFRELKRQYPASLWAQKLKYYW